jgi:signal transduction histidine kinase
MVSAAHSLPEPDPERNTPRAAPLPRRIDPARHAGGLTAMATAAALLVTLAISVSGELRFAFYSPTGSVALETAAGLVAALAAFLAYGRFRITHELIDLALVAALGVLAATVVLFFTGPAVAARPVGALAVWARALGTALAAVAFAAAAFVRQGTTAARRRRLRRAIVMYGLTAVGVLVVLLVVRPRVGVPREVPTSALARPLVVGSPLLLAVNLVAAIFFALASVGFLRRCRERGDAFVLALALSMPLGSGAAIHYFLFPSRYPNYVFTGDVFRLAFFAAVLAGVLAQIGSYQRVGERLGIARERERLARDLHDGPVQELALLRLLIDRLSARVEDPLVVELDERSRAALSEWRSAVVAAPAEDGPLGEMLKRTAGSLTGGTGVKVEVDVAHDLTLSADERTDVEMIVREAVSNAVRHGGARHIRVTVAGRPLDVAIADDGRWNANAGAHRGQGRGIDGMRERAARLGGELCIDHAACGTTVRVQT